MEFVDRVNEIARISRALASEKQCFVVIYGRRRLGKSTLIKKVLSAQDVYFEADKNEAAVQMALLVSAINAAYPEYGGMKFDSWEKLLVNFNMFCHQNSTLVLDEFPYLVQKTPSLPSTLQRLVDSKTLRFNLILCGSSQRMMQRIILDSSEPLYGRADEKMNLSPIGLKSWYETMSLSPVDAIEEYSVWGGVPRYWALRDTYDNFSSALDQLILDEQGLLFDEPASLFMDEIAEIAPYSSIMTALGSGNNRFSKVADTVGKKTTELSAPLNNLIAMKYIRKEVPFGEAEEKTRKTLYQIDDPFMAFYYRFIAPNRSLLALGRKERVREIISQKMSEHVSHIWERICQIAVSGNLLLGVEWDMARRWWGRIPVYPEGKKTPLGFEELEFDVVAESVDKKSILIGECKWAQADYAGRLLDKLRAKAQKVPFTAGKQVIYVLFLKEQPLDKSSAHNIFLPADVINNLP